MKTLFSHIPLVLTAHIVSCACLISLLVCTPASAQTSSDTTAIVKPTPANDHSATEGMYPDIARILWEEGTVLLTFTVEKDGTVDNVSVTKSSGWPRLDAASVDMVGHRWLYHPATQNGQPVAVTNKVNVVWNLTGPKIAKYDMIIETSSDYPPRSRDRHEEGVVIAALAVDEAGHVWEYNLLHSSGFADLDDVSQAILTRHSRFTPASVEGKPILTWIHMAVIWSLDPAEAAAN